MARKDRVGRAPREPALSEAEGSKPSEARQLPSTEIGRREFQPRRRCLEPAERFMQRLENRYRQPDPKNPRKHRHYEKLNSHPRRAAFAVATRKLLTLHF